MLLRDIQIELGTSIVDKIVHIIPLFTCIREEGADLLEKIFTIARMHQLPIFKTADPDIAESLAIRFKNRDETEKTMALQTLGAPLHGYLLKEIYRTKKLEGQDWASHVNPPCKRQLF